MSKLPEIDQSSSTRQAATRGEKSKNKNSIVLGARLASFRKLHGLSLEQVAMRAGITKSYLSKLERDLSSPTIATLLKLAKALNVSSEQLIGDEAQDNEILVVKAQDRMPFSRSNERDGYTYEAIAAQRTDKAMMPFVMSPPSTVDTKTDMASHAGEELIFVISGKMEVIFTDRTIRLDAGDSIYFNASIPHRSRSIGKIPAKALVVVTEVGKHGPFSKA